MNSWLIAIATDNIKTLSGHYGVSVDAMQCTYMGHKLQDSLSEKYEDYSIMEIVLFVMYREKLKLLIEAINDKSSGWIPDNFNDMSTKLQGAINTYMSRMRSDLTFCNDELSLIGDIELMITGGSK